MRVDEKFRHHQEVSNIFMFIFFVVVVRKKALQLQFSYLFFKYNAEKKKSILTAQVRFLLPRTAYHSHIHHRQPGVPVAFVSSYVKEYAVKNTSEQESINKIWQFKGYWGSVMPSGLKLLQQAVHTQIDSTAECERLFCGIS